MGTQWDTSRMLPAKGSVNSPTAEREEERSLSWPPGKETFHFTPENVTEGSCSLPVTMLLLPDRSPRDF